MRKFGFDQFSNKNIQWILDLTISNLTIILDLTIISRVTNFLLNKNTQFKDIWQIGATRFNNIFSAHSTKNVTTACEKDKYSMIFKVQLAKKILNRSTFSL